MRRVARQPVLASILVMLLSGASAFCPKHCNCNFDEEQAMYVSTCGNGDTSRYVIVKMGTGAGSEVMVQCQGENITCSDIPQPPINFNDTHTLDMQFCPEPLLGCVEDMLKKKPILTIFLNINKGILIIDGVQGMEKNLGITINDYNTSNPINAIKLLLPSLEEFKISTNNFQFTSNMFAKSRALTSLIVHHSNTATIPADCFSGLERLNMLTFTKVTIDVVSANAFRGLNELDLLHFEECKIKTIEPGAFSTAPQSMRLKKIIMLGYQLEAIPDGLLEGLQYLEIVALSNNGTVEMKLGSNAFSHLPSLQYMVIIRANIRTLPEDVFKGIQNIYELNLERNMIEVLPTEIFSALFRLNNLNLNYNRLVTLPEYIFSSLKKLTILNLSYNRFEILPQALFHGLQKLAFLSLDNNNLKTISAEFYISVTSSNHLIDSESEILNTNNSSNDFALSNVKKVGSPFRFMTKLIALRLSGNQIHEMYNDWDKDMLHIAQIELSSNNFTDFKDFDVDYSNSETIIDLQYNHITNVMLDPRITPDSIKPLERFLILDDNPIVCDCTSYGLYQRLKGIRSHRDPVYIIKHSTCTSPPNLKGRLLKDVSPDQLACDMPQYRPDNCSSCTVRVDTKELRLYCSQMPAVLPNLKDENITKYYFEEPALVLRLDNQPASIEGYNIHTLNLSRTDIRTITFHPSKSLQVLDLAHNHLSTIPDEFLKGNITLYLSGNSFECECGFVTHMDNLRRSGLLPDFEQITCVNGDKIVTIDVNVLCSKSLALVAQAGMGLFLVVVIIAILKHSRYIWYLFTTKILRRPVNPLEAFEMRVDAAKEYDLFISYAHEDSHFVANSLLPKLENDYKQKVCVHSRDWIVGDLITDQIITSVERSRRTMIILTENFLVSEWAYLEFRTAHNLSIQEGKPRVILILLDEAITRDERLESEFKSYVTLNSYFLWGEPDFWGKLKKVLPKGVNKAGHK